MKMSEQTTYEHKTLREKFIVELLNVFRVTHDGRKLAARAESRTMARRIACALNRYVPGSRGY